MSARKPREALDVVRGLEDALVALERSFAALDVNSSPQRAEAGWGAPAIRHDRPAPLAPEEHRRLTKHLEALLDEVRQLADFLANDRSDPDSREPD